MTAERAFAIIRSRWVVFASVAAVVGLVFAVAALQLADVEPRFRAIAPVNLIGDQDLSSLAEETLVEQTSRALSLAEEANRDLLAQNAGTLEIVAVPDAARIEFIAVARTRDAAFALASQARDNYLQSQPLDIGAQVEAQIEELELRLAEVRSRIAQLAGPDPSIASIEEERTRLEGVLSNLRSRLIGLDATLLAPPAEFDEVALAALRAEKDALVAAIEEVEAQLAALPVVEADFTERATLRRALVAQYRTIESEYQDRFILLASLGGTGGAGPVVTLDETPQPIAPVTAAAVGMGLGLLAAMLGLLVSDRIRPRLWFPDDLGAVPALTIIGPREGPSSAAAPWYDLAATGTRRRQLQTLRSAVMRRAGGHSAVGFVSAGLRPTDLLELVADLGASVSATGGRVLIVDALVGGSHAVPMEFGGGTTLVDLLSYDPDALESVLSTLPEVRPGLSGVVAGHAVGDPNDLLSSPTGRSFLSVARRVFDLVIVGLGEPGDGATASWAPGVDGVVLAVQHGRTTLAEVDAAIAELAVLGATPFGAVYLVRDRRLARRLRPTVRAARPEPAVEASPSEVIARLLSDHRTRGEVPVSSAPSPAVDGSPGPGHGAPVPEPRAASTKAPDLHRPQVTVHEPPDEGTGHGRAVDQAGEELAEGVAAVLEDRVRAVVRAAPSDRARWPSVALDQVVAEGFVPAVRMEGLPTIGELVLETIRADLGDETYRELVGPLGDDLRATLGMQESDLVALVDAWVRERFFRRHVKATDRQPTIWHIRSKGGTVHLLVSAERFDRATMESFAEHRLAPFADALARKARSSRQTDRVEVAHDLQEAAKDVRSLQLAFGWLHEGSMAAARLWFPWRKPSQQPSGWSPDLEKGIRPHLAPLQRLGILGWAVLTEDELEAMSPPGGS